MLGLSCIKIPATLAGAVCRQEVPFPEKPPARAIHTLAPSLTLPQALARSYQYNIEPSLRWTHYQQVLDEEPALVDNRDFSLRLKRSSGLFKIVAQMNQRLSSQEYYNAQRRKIDSQVYLKDQAVKNEEGEAFSQVVEVFCTLVGEGHLVDFYETIFKKIKSPSGPSSSTLLQDGYLHCKAATARARYQMAQADFLRWVGVLSSVREWPGFLLPLPPTQAEAVDQALCLNPALQEAAYRVQAARNGLQMETSGPLPYLDTRVAVGGTIGHIDGVSKGLESEIQISFPLSSVKEAARRAGYALTAARLEYERVRRRLIHDVTRHWIALQTARTQLPFIVSQLQAHELTCRQNNSLGSKNILGVLEREEEWARTLELWVQTKKTELVSGYRLLALMGQLTVERLNLPVDCYGYSPSLEELTSFSSQQPSLTQKRGVLSSQRERCDVPFF